MVVGLHNDNFGSLSDEYMRQFTDLFKTPEQLDVYKRQTLQREANRYYSFTAQQTLELVQSLYEKKLLTCLLYTSRCV